MIFVNGFRKSAYTKYTFTGGNLFNKRPWNKTPLYDKSYSWGKKGGNYWKSGGKDVEGFFKKQFNDNNAIYVDGMYKPHSKAQDRYDRGIEDAKAIIKKIESGEIEYKAGETIKLVGHSHGGWHSTGMADAFAKAGYKVEGLYAINPHQPTENVKRLEGVPDYLSVQYSRKTDQVSSDQSELPGGKLGDILVGDSEYGQMPGVDEFYQLVDWKKAELGGHNVEAALDEIKLIDKGEAGYVRSPDDAKTEKPKNEVKTKK